MRQLIKPFVLLLVAALAARLLGMWLLPLADTTEPRYAEIARLMAESGDWITPWFEPGVPFWGKPPLAFWSQAAAFRLFGISEFAARLPALLVTLATLALLFELARRLRDARVARWATAIYATSLLPYVTAGAVMIDPFLTLGTTLCMGSFALAAQQPRSRWGYAFFVGLALGLLAKGPLTGVLVFGPIALWALRYRDGRDALVALPWRGGLLLCAAMTLPWYIIAELKTPGFLHYFLLGENVLRFIDPGWSGDRYGNAHRHAYGTIWWYWIGAAFPWSLIALGALLKRLFDAIRAQRWPALPRDAWQGYLLSWALFTPLFFTLAGNILWTYVLPALPAFALLLAIHLQKALPERPHRLQAMVLIAPLLIAGLCLLAAVQPERLKSEKALISYAALDAAPQSRLLYVQSRPFSARFYSFGAAELIAPEQLVATLTQPTDTDTYIALPKRLLLQAQQQIDNLSAPLYSSKRYVLVKLPASANTASIMSATPQQSTAQQQDEG